jgi:threonine/homoserine/homoserine lactone efflux protein
MSAPFSESLTAFALTALVIEITPGPNMGYLAVLSLSRGWWVGIAAVSGVALGHAVYGVAAALGVAAAIDASPVLYEILRWAGVAYMLWLAYEAWSTEAETSPDVTRDHFSHSRLAFRRGLITNLLNPKAAVFFVAVVPTFVRPNGSIVAQTLLLSAIFVAVATAVHTAIVLLAGWVQPYAADPARRRPVRRALALVLAAIAAWIAYSTAR